MVDFAKKTCFKAGGLLLDKPDLTLASAAGPAGEAPLCVDNRSLLLKADDQGTTSQCAAYTMATVIEVALWKKTRERTTINPVPIYERAKQIDGNNVPGTYLDSVFKAAKELNLISQDATMTALRTKAEVKFAVRESEVCLLGFNITAGWNNVNKRTGFIGPDAAPLGGHAVVGCWYNDTPGARDTGIGIGNSWSSKWGVNGFARITWAQFDEQFIHGIVLGNL